MTRLLSKSLLILILVLAPLALAVVLTEKALPPKLKLAKTDFSELPAWPRAGHQGAFAAFLESCDKLTPRPGFLIPQEFWTENFYRAFNDACAKAREGEGFYGASGTAAKTFFEENFDPFQMQIGFSRRGKITGYYEPLMEASFEPSAEYRYPIYGAPGDQVKIDLSRFRENLSGTLIGRLEGKTVLPYYTRRDINEGALRGKDLEILYAKDPVDVYFLQVQGSGRARLPDGTIIGVGYAGKNGHPNTLAGRTLVELGALELDEVSMPSIRNWFEENPERTFEILHRDDSYVFFRLTGGEGPFGSSGAVLTPGHSVAVDPAFVPMGLPVFIDGEIPVFEGKENQTEDFQDLLVAQDTGGIIRGGLRADIFWGRGERAAFLAGHMNNQARFTLLVPKGALEES